MVSILYMFNFVLKSESSPLRNSGNSTSRVIIRDVTKDWNGKRQLTRQSEILKLDERK